MKKIFTSILYGTLITLILLACVFIYNPLLGLVILGSTANTIYNIFTPDTKTITLASSTYEFPRNFIRGKKSYYLSHEYMWSPVKLQITEEVTINGHRKMSLVVFDNKINGKDDTYNRISHKNYYKSTPDNSIGGLEGYVYYTKTANGRIFQWDSIYKDNWQSKHPTTIKCSKSEGVVSKKCELVFVNNSLIYSITFSRKHLQNWKEIKKENIEFINMHKIK